MSVLIYTYICTHTYTSGSGALLGRLEPDLSPAGRRKGTKGVSNIYLSIYLSIFLSSTWISRIYVECVYKCMYVYIYICICIEREKERSTTERGGDKGGRRSWGHSANVMLFDLDLLCLPEQCRAAHIYIYIYICIYIYIYIYIIHIHYTYIYIYRHVQI